MATRQQIEQAFAQSGVGRSPSDYDYAFYANYPDAGRVEGDLRAGGNGASSGAGTSSIGSLSFDQKAAEQKALAELTPYYQKLLDMYGGDIALAKQRLDQDYQTGLRTKTDAVEWSKTDIDQSAIERKRKYQIALNDLDQTMNSRGLINSGIRTTEQERAAASEQFNVQQDQRAKEQLNKGLEQFKAEQDVNRTRKLEELGYIKPMTNEVTGQFAPSQTGLVAPSGASVANYKPASVQDAAAKEEEKKQRALEMANLRQAQAYTSWQALASQAQSLMK